MVTGAALVIGESLVDVVSGADAHTDYPGGSAANVAVALARLGRPTWLATSFAEDEYGALLAGHLSAQRRAAGRRPRRRGAVLLGGGHAGPERCGVLRLRPGLAAQRGAAARGRGPGRGARLLDRRGARRPGCEDVFLEVGLLRGAATVSYDINLRPSISGTGPEVVARIERLVAASDVVKASDEDLEGLRPGVSLADAAEGLLGLGPTAVVVTRGGEGVSLFTGAGRLDLPAMPGAGRRHHRRRRHVRRRHPARARRARPAGRRARARLRSSTTRAGARCSGTPPGPPR